MSLIPRNLILLLPDLGLTTTVCIQSVFTSVACPQCLTIFSDICKKLLRPPINLSLTTIVLLYPKKKG